MYMPQTTLPIGEPVLPGQCNLPKVLLHEHVLVLCDELQSGN